MKEKGFRPIYNEVGVFFIISLITVFLWLYIATKFLAMGGLTLINSCAIAFSATVLISLIILYDQLLLRSKKEEKK